MSEVVANSVVVAALLGIAGLPFALGRPDARRSVSALLHDSLTSGVAVVTTGIATWVWGGWLGLGAFVVVATGLAGWALRRAGRPDLAALAPRIEWWTVALGVVLVVATLLRLRFVDFLPWSGDMGDYVNAANRFARDGTMDTIFPPAFTAYLAVPSALFGSAATTTTVPLLGVLFVSGLLRVAGQVGMPPVVRIALAVVAAVAPHAIWYSSFPVSEVLQAVVLLALLSAVLEAVSDEGADRRAGRVAGRVGSLLGVALFATAMSLTRGTAPLILVPLGLLLAATLVRPWRRHSEVIGVTTAVAILGTGVGYVYGVSEIHTYYVGNQIETILPGRIFRIGDRLGLFDPGIVTVAAIIAAAVVVALVGRQVTRRSAAADAGGGDEHDIEATPTHPRRWWAWPWPLGLVLAVGAIGAFVVEGPGEIRNQLFRLGIGVLVLALVGLAVPTATRLASSALMLFAGSTAVLMLVLQNSRFDVERGHNYFIYWDRYLYSELFPMGLLLAALTVWAALERADRWGVTPGRVGRGVLALAVLAFAASSYATVRRVTRHSMLEGSHDFVAGLLELMPDESQEILWSAEADAPIVHNPVFANTWHAYGLPLQRSFGRTVRGVSLAEGPFQPDRALPAEQLAHELSCSADHRAYVVEIDYQGTELDDRLARELDEADVTRLGTVRERIPVNPMAPGADWVWFDLEATVWELSMTAEDLPPCG